MKNSYLVCSGIEDNMHAVFNNTIDSTLFIESNRINVYKRCGSMKCAIRYLNDQIESGFDFLRILTTTVTDK